MKKSALGTHNYEKPFIIALGIAFTVLALVVLYIACSNGGMDIRSSGCLNILCTKTVF